MIINISQISHRNIITSDEKRYVVDHMDEFDLDDPIYIDIYLKVKNKNQYIKSILLDKKQITIKFKLPKILYHGTYTPYFKTLEPQLEDYQQKIKGRNIYATPIIWLAVLFSKKRYIKKKYGRTGLSYFLDFSKVQMVAI